MAVVRDSAAMIAGMRPVLGKEEFVFATLGADQSDLTGAAVASCREDEGLSVVLPLAVAADAGFDCALAMRRITLQVHSALDGVGLTAAVAGVLAGAGIACNIVAGHHHDHAFVPADRAEEARDLLLRLASAGAP